MFKHIDDRIQIDRVCGDEYTRYAPPPKLASSGMTKGQRLFLWGAFVAFVVFIGAILATNGGCAMIEKIDAVDPASYTPAPGYPCGPMYTPCSLTADGGCGSSCAKGNICGGPNTGCPAGSCCDDEPLEQGPTYGARAGGEGDAGARPLRVVGPMHHP
jgi:hypothetical protein